MRGQVGRGRLSAAHPHNASSNCGRETRNLASPASPRGLNHRRPGREVGAGVWPGREASTGKLTTVKDRIANRAYFIVASKRLGAREEDCSRPPGDGSAERRP
jgi:hypothetical protein